MLTLLVFLIILGVLVFVHELGHFVVARRNGIKCDEFGFGFPPRAVGVYKDEKKGKWEFVIGNKHIESKNTIYSLNWFPLGGFVKIKGEDGEGKKEKDSFAAKSAWIRIKVLAAGVTMNFILAWVLFSWLLTMGINQEVDQNDTSVSGTKIQIASVVAKSPAYEMGIREGDTVIKCVGEDARCAQTFANIAELQAFVADNKGMEITLQISRGSDLFDFTGVPRLEAPVGEGLLGIGLAQTTFVKYTPWEAIKQGPVVMWNVLVMMGIVIKSLFAGDVSNIGGPLAIAHFTKQATALGFSSIVQLAALLSVNLGIVNILPIPALDGGRILFVLIEKIKGSPVSQETEGTLHTIGFFLLMLLMVYLVVNDLMRYGLGGIF
ncbi:MAG: Membrane-associated zinc metalloprotease [Candidatus Moranbacteria bacterium GW2011_GWC2_37_8]|nr:MAG: Membrane-associated zinc metalloprotease [Candidatus Moranbacteria bacterium GW2011_GWC2_37_8]KKQ62905.1 MAG: membrane-associated zinc metalloprotease [Parcubacteria group bacterium GW2011_GWC1_38_22]KKQ81465.1 MAG: Membrane-associated zinc metalloprotease [Candidatus Moranbacteria bacterium GW2011_GWD2_38_7]